MAKNILKLKETEKATFCSPSDEWVLPAASAIKPEEREFVVDSGASMRKVSRKDLDSAELETVRISQSPTMVVTANGDVPTKEEATVCVRELDSLDLYVTAMLLEDTPTVLSLGKLCGDHGCNYHWTGVRNHISSKMAGRSIAIRRTPYPSLSLVCRQSLRAHLHLLLLHLHRRIP